MARGPGIRSDSEQVAKAEYRVDWEMGPADVAKITPHCSVFGGLLQPWRGLHAFMFCCIGSALLDPQPGVVELAKARTPKHPHERTRADSEGGVQQRPISTCGVLRKVRSACCSADTPLALTGSTLANTG